MNRIRCLPHRHRRLLSQLVVRRLGRPPMSSERRADLHRQLRSRDAVELRSAVLGLVGDRAPETASALLDLGLDLDAPVVDRRLALRAALYTACVADLDRLDAAILDQADAPIRRELLGFRAYRHDGDIVELCEWIYLIDQDPGVRYLALVILEDIADDTCIGELLSLPAWSVARQVARYLDLHRQLLWELPPELVGLAPADGEERALDRRFWPAAVERWRKALREPELAGSDSHERPAVTSLRPPGFPAGVYRPDVRFVVHVLEPPRLHDGKAEARFALEPPDLETVEDDDEMLAAFQLMLCFQDLFRGVLWVRVRDAEGKFGRVLAWGTLEFCDSFRLVAHCTSPCSPAIEAGLEMEIPEGEYELCVQHPRWGIRAERGALPPDLEWELAFGRPGA